MTLTHLTDVTCADWFVGATQDWSTLASQGVPGFAAYATVWYDDENAASWRGDAEVMARVVGIAAAHTTSPDMAYFGLWDGWGDLHAGSVFTMTATSSSAAADESVTDEDFAREAALAALFDSDPPAVPGVVPPALAPEIVGGPKADLVGVRSFLMFRGALADVGQWGQRGTLEPAAITWPQDRAWFIASDVDPEWLCIGGSADLIAAVLADPDLDAEPATYGSPPPDHHEQR